MVRLYAIKGVSGENPENTVPAFHAAADQGYFGIEVTARVSKDMHCVVLNDAAINRTARRADGSIIGAALPVAELTYEQLLSFDFGIGYHVKFKGTRIPKLEEVLEFARVSGLKVKIDVAFSKLRPEHKQVLLSLLDGYGDVAELSVCDLATLEEMTIRYPDMHLHFEGAADHNTLRQVCALVPGERITFWLPCAAEDTALEVKKYASLGIRGLSRGTELEWAEKLGADVVCTNGALKPEQNKGLLPDMHVHTDHSHDAHYPMEQMLQNGIEQGLGVIAVADHCDTTRCENDPDWDIYTNIREACREVDALNEKYAHQCLLLRGVELGDGIWFPEQSNRVARQLPYDVIVGATHAVRCQAAEAIPLKEKWFSQIKYLELPEDQFDELARNYFADMQTMVETQNIDIMAHLLCVSGYYVYRHRIFKDMRPYEEQMVQILKTIIRKGIAMEMSRQFFEEHNGSYPYYWVVEKYYELGGYLITLSTDAHAADEVGKGFEKRISMLKQTGFTHILYYKDRKAVPCSL